jgi:superfamily II RNA helicase
MRDKKMLEKLATHKVKNVSELFSLADKCARAVEGRAWRSQPTPEAGKAGKPKADATAQSIGKNKNRKKKKSNNNNQSLAGVDVSYAAPQAYKIVNVALHREYSSGIVFIFSQWRKDLYHV